MTVEKKEKGKEGASTVDGATIDRLTHRKRVTEYPDLATSPQIEY